MNLKTILKKQIKKKQIYRNIVKIHKKNDIIKLGIPIGIILLGGMIFLIKKGKIKNDRNISTQNKKFVQKCKQ